MTTDDHTQSWHIHVSRRSVALDGHGRAILHDARQVGLAHLTSVRSSVIYRLAGALCGRDVESIATELLADPVSEVATWGRGLAVVSAAAVTIEVQTLPGVMNPTAISAKQAIDRHLASLGTARSVEAVQTARRYEIEGARGIEDLERLASCVLANDCIETWYLRGFGRNDDTPSSFPTPPLRPFELRHVALTGRSDDELAALSREAHLFLSVPEMRAVRDHFAHLGRDPTDLELETLAQTWSEHCVHKTLKSGFDYEGPGFGDDAPIRIHFDNLLKDTIAKATADLDRDWCLSVFVDNAGVIAFDEDYGIAFKAETHNHPSAIEPYGGAATGIGGCIRDIMGCGLGAKPIASTDVFCVAPPDFDEKRLPNEVLHPRRVLKGIVGGVRDYGNRMGIPTVNGAIYFDERYVANPLVFCGCIGLIPRRLIDKRARPGDRIVVVGGRTGRDGIHGATFSSAELTEQHADEFSHAVQIGNPVEEKKVLDALLRARDHEEGCLYSAVTDCGAGGLSSAVGEMGAEIGASVDLSEVPLKYPGLRYDEIWISEAQERMVFAVTPERLDKFLAICREEEVEATVIGTFTDDKWLRVHYQGERVGELEMHFLHEGVPKQTLTAKWNPGPQASDCAVLPTAADPQANEFAHATHEPLTNEALLRAIGALNTASKEWVIRQYDHEVQGRSVIKPLVGPGFGPSDAAVLRPRYDSDLGLAIACGLCPELGDLDPYRMAIAAVDEALRNVICVGANPGRVAILDNFCWPKVDNEQARGALVRACRGAYDAAVAYGLPFISGKDSLNNEFAMSEAEAQRTGFDRHIAIPYTLLISAVGLIDHVADCVTMDLKVPGHRLVAASAPVEDVGLAQAKALHDRVAALIAAGKVHAAHDVSDGGLAVAVAEMCLAGDCGATIEIEAAPFAHDLLAPMATTYVLEMTEQDAAECVLPVIGVVEANPRLRINAPGDVRIDLAVSELAEAWRAPLAQGGGR